MRFCVLVFFGMFFKLHQNFFTFLRPNTTNHGVELNFGSLLFWHLDYHYKPSQSTKIMNETTIVSFNTNICKNNDNTNDDNDDNTNNHLQTALQYREYVVQQSVMDGT